MVTVSQPLMAGFSVVFLSLGRKEVPIFKSREGALEALVAILERSYEDGGKNNTKLQVIWLRFDIE